MEKLLSKIYDMVVFNEKDSIRYGAEFDAYVNVDCQVKLTHFYV